MSESHESAEQGEALGARTCYADSDLAHHPLQCPEQRRRKGRRTKRGRKRKRRRWWLGNEFNIKHAFDPPTFGRKGHGSVDTNPPSPDLWRESPWWSMWLSLLGHIAINQQEDPGLPLSMHTACQSFKTATQRTSSTASTPAVKRHLEKTGRAMWNPGTGLAFFSLGSTLRATN